jgi:phenylpyruvate tautomerase PptA (4-oxalocrotonate tautomerase family)
MPLLSVATNIELADPERAEFITTASRLTAEMLGKPERYVMVHLRDGQAMSFAGSTDPLAYCELKSIGLPTDRTTEFSRQLCELLQSRLSIPTDRVYIEFSDAERNLWGWNGGTF